MDKNNAISRYEGASLVQRNKADLYFDEMENEIKDIFEDNEVMFGIFMKNARKVNTIGHHFDFIKSCSLPTDIPKGETIDNMDLDLSTQKFCRYFRECDLYQCGAAPVGKKCPHEINLVYTTTKKLFSQFIIDLDSNTMEEQAVAGYVAQVLNRYRAYKELAASGGRNVIVSKEYVKEGINYVQGTHPALEAIARAEKEISNYMKKFVASKDDRIRFNLEKKKLELDTKQMNTVKKINEKTKVREGNKIGLIKKPKIEEAKIIDLDEDD